MRGFFCGGRLSGLRDWSGAPEGEDGREGRELIPPIFDLMSARRDLSFSSVDDAGVDEEFEVAASISLPMGPPFPPPQRGVVVHHFPSPKRLSSFPSRLRCWAVSRMVMISRARSRFESRGVVKDVVERHERAARGPSRKPKRAELRSVGVR